MRLVVVNRRDMLVGGGWDAGIFLRIGESEKRSEGAETQGKNGDRETRGRGKLEKR